jgi:phage/plasmid-associated DNA primase
MLVRVSKNIQSPTPRLIEIDVEKMSWDKFEKEGYSCEYIKESDITRLYFDFDYKMKEDESTPESIEYDYNLYMNAILPILRKNSSIYDFVYTNGSWFNEISYKISLHIIFKSKFIKRSIFDVHHEQSKKYIDQVFQGLNDQIKKDIENTVDNSVYGKKHWFRLPLGGWFNNDKPYCHIPQSNTEVSNYLVSFIKDYNGIVINPSQELLNSLEFYDEKEPKNAITNEESKNDMIEMLEMVKKTRFQEYKNWMDLFFLIKGQNLSKELFIRYSKESGFKKFSEEECNTIWYKTDAKKGYGFPLIHRWLEEDGVNWKAQFCKKKSNMISDLLKAFYEAGTLTDLAVSEIFYKNYKDSLYFTQQGWIHYNDYRGWEIGTDDDIIYPLMKLIGERFISFANKMKPKEDEKDEKEFSKKVKSIKKEGVRLCSASVCQKIIKTSKTLFKNDEIINEFDNKPYWFCFKNMKAIDLKTKQVIDVKKEDKITKHCGYDMPERNEKYIQEAIKFVKSIQGEDITSYMSCISTSLCGNPSLNQLIYIHTGIGGNGKSVIFKALRYVLGNYHGMLPIDNLTKNSNGKDSADSSLVSLNGVRCAQSNEPEDEKDTTIKVARVKEYSGEQFIKCRDLHKSAFQMRITFNLNLLCNTKPKLSKSDEAIERRIRCIPYPYKFVDNPDPTNPLQKSKDYNLEDHITTNEDFRNGFLYLLIDNWYMNQGKYIMNESQKQETEEYIKSNNPLLEFLNDYSSNTKETMNIRDLQKIFNNNYYNSNVSPQQFLTFTLQLGFKIAKEDKSNGHKIYIQKKLYEEN